MRLKECLCRTRQVLTDHDIDDAPLEGELLLRQALGISRIQLYQNFDNELNPEQQERLQRLTERRLNGEPSAYINGQREFYGLDFYVNRNTLIPRPETELLVEKLIILAQDYKQLIIADVGTGCGAIAVSLAKHLPQAIIYASDMSSPALEIARQNAQKHGVSDSIRFLEGDLLDPLPESVDFIAANLPYVRQADINADSYEPRLSLDGGIDGLDIINRFCRQLNGRLRSSGCLLLEIGQGQSSAVREILSSLLPSAVIEITPDLSGIERIVTMRLTH